MSKPRDDWVFVWGGLVLALVLVALAILILIPIYRFFWPLGVAFSALWLWMAWKALTYESKAPTTDDLIDMLHEWNRDRRGI